MGNKNLFDILNRDNFNKAIEDLKHEYENKCGECDDLRKELEKVKDKKFKNKELARLSKLYEETCHNSIEIMSGKEKKDYDDFFNEHWRKHLEEKYGTTNVIMKNPLPGWKHIVELTGTGVGTGIDVVCPICGERKDITDYSNW